jgi:two-component system, OmpR family, lantibiotic biosynthesis sensor histidine kinase NisK/SpaK
MQRLHFNSVGHWIQMGKLKKWKKSASLRTQLVTSFHLVLLFSILATIITAGAIVLCAIIFLIPNGLNPANYYEKKIPDVLAFVQKHESNVTSRSFQSRLEKEIPTEGIGYQILNKEGDVVYGSIEKTYIRSKRDLYSKLNSDIHDGTYFVKLYPLFNREKEVNGAVLLRYKLTLASSNPKDRLFIVGATFLLFSSPFLYFYLFSYLFGRRFSRKIEKPFNELIDASHKIQRNDLEFSLPKVQESRELDQLVHAFEDMRVALKESLTRQWKLEEDRKEMTAAIAHDLRTPLTIIHGHTEGLLEGSKNNPKRLDDYLQTIFRNTVRSIRLLDQLRDVSVLENVTFSVKKEPINIREFVESKGSEFELLSQKKDVYFSYMVHGEQEFFHIDPHLIGQAFDNVITNCIRYTPRGGKITWNITTGNETVLFEVKDSGPGFAQNHNKKLFEKFYREDQSRGSTEGNAGLGLYIAHSIVQNHGGEIEAYNQKEGGAYIKIELPLT